MSSLRGPPRGVQFPWQRSSHCPPPDRAVTMADGLGILLACVRVFDYECVAVLQEGDQGGGGMMCSGSLQLCYYGDTTV